MRSAKHIIAGLGSLFLFTGIISAGDNSGGWEPLQTSVQLEPVNTAVPIMRAFVNVRSDQFTFLIPDNFRLSGDAAHGRLQVVSESANILITFTILGPVPSDSPVLDAGAYREMLLNRYPDAKILSEFRGQSAGSESGPGFDLERKGAVGLTQRIRAIYLPTIAGVLELTVTSGSNNSSAAQSSLSSILGTLSSGQNGKLVIRHIIDRI